MTEPIAMVDAARLFAVEVPEELKEAIQPEGVSGWDILVAVLVVVVAIPISRWVDRLVQRLAKRVPDIAPDTARIAGHISRYFVYFVAWAIALALVGVDVGWAVAIAVVFLIIIALTLRPLMTNSAAGLLLQARPAFGVGDTVEVAGYRGEVEEINARTTVLKTIDGLRVHIPNTEVLGAPLVIYTAYESRRASVELAIGAAEDLDHVTDVLVAAVSAVEHVVAYPAPDVRAREFGDGTVVLSVRWWFGPDTHTDVPVTDAVVRALQQAMDAEGISMPAPELLVETRDDPSPSSGPASAAPDDSGSGQT